MNSRLTAVETLLKEELGESRKREEDTPGTLGELLRTFNMHPATREDLRSLLKAVTPQKTQAIRGPTGYRVATGHQRFRNRVTHNPKGMVHDGIKTEIIDLVSPAIGPKHRHHKWQRRPASRLSSIQLTPTPTPGKSRTTPM